jgi:diguanylate cyclase (GGDEF)-like protein/PAS domain S-box-containing protein
MKPNDWSGAGSVGVLVSNPGDRRLLVQFIEEQGYKVVATDSTLPPVLLSDFALMIIDEAAARRHAPALLAKKREVAPLVLPVLVLVTRAVDSAAWIKLGFEDVLRLPLAKAELAARLEAFQRLRLQSESALQDSEARFRETFDQAPSGIAHTTTDGRFLMVNRRLSEIFGYSEQELLGMRLPDLSHADDRETMLSVRRELLSGESRACRSERRFLRKDGGVLWADVTVSLARGLQGEPKYLISLLNDISERKRLEESVRKIARARKVMAECNHVLVHAGDEPALLQQMCEAVVAFGDYRTAWIGQQPEGEPEAIITLAFAGADLPWMPAADSGLRVSRASEDGPVAKALRSRVALIENDLPNAPHLGEWREAARGNGVGSAVVLPLLSETACLGLLVIYAAETGAFDRDEVELLEELANDIAYGIDTLRTRIARHQAETAQRESERFALATIDALPANICVIDGTGAIIATNRSWQAFAADNGHCGGDSTAAGYNYLQVADEAAAAGVREAAIVSEALREIIRGERDRFDIEYECSSPTQERWVLMTASRFDGEVPVRLVISHEDITARRVMDNRVRESEARFRSLSNLSSDWYWEQDEHFRFSALSGSTLDQVWSQYQACLGKTPWEAHAAAPARHFVNLGEPEWAAHRALLDARQPFRDLYVEHRRPGGGISQATISGEPVVDETGRFRGYRGTGKDITGLKRAERDLFLARERLGFLLSATPAVIYACASTSPHALTFISDNVRELLGYEPQALLDEPRHWLDRLHPDDAARVGGDFAKVFENGRHVDDYRIRRKDGSYLWVQEEIRLVEGLDGGSREIVGYLIDINDKKRAEQQLMHLAHYDDLTQLPNRVLFRDRLTQAVAQAQRNNWTIGVMFLDVDRFKLINDTLGHVVGDELLRMVSARLAGAIRTGDTVGRLGGDEFAVILADLARPQDVRQVADKLQQAFATPFRLRDREVYISLSIGITLYPVDGTGPDDLIKNADVAMYRAKELGRNNVQFYTAEMNRRANEWLDLENSLRRAMEREEFLLFYQPRVDVVSGRMVGMEALLRWKRADGTMVSPGVFVPLLEETGLIMLVGDWVLQTACLQQAQWRSAGLPLVPIAVNVSPRQLHDQSMAARVREIVTDCNADPGMLELELTESSLMRNPEEVVRMLSEIRALGVRIAIDDFGTGYSSLSYLKRFPLDCLKIDQSFVRDITTDEDDGAIVRTIISIARQMNLQVVAEGVETAEQLAFLKALDCDEAQGYLFARPMPAGEIGERLLELGRARLPAAPVASPAA